MSSSSSAPRKAASAPSRSAKRTPAKRAATKRIDLGGVDAPLTDAELARLRPASKEMIAMFAAAQESARKQGRPRKVNPKVALKLRIDHDVVEAFKAEGPGWQTSMNAALRKAKGLRG